MVKSIEIYQEWKELSINQIERPLKVLADKYKMKEKQIIKMLFEEIERQG
jgi:hypothetical protein